MRRRRRGRVQRRRGRRLIQGGKGWKLKSKGSAGLWRRRRVDIA